MAASTLRKVGQGLGGLFLSLTGSWLLVICVGGLLTLGVLSVFHLGVLLSLGCIGIGLLVAGVCALCGLRSKASPHDTSNRLLDDEGQEWSLSTQADVKKSHPYERPLESIYRPHPNRSITETSNSRYNRL